MQVKINSCKDTTNDTKTLLNEAKRLINLGFWIVPTVGKISKSRNDKNNRLSFDDFKKIVIEKKCNGLGVLTNEHTKYLSFDLDTKDATNPTLFKKRLFFELDNFPVLKSKIKLSESPSGGFHLYILLDTDEYKKSFIGAFAWSEYNKEKQKQTVTGRANGQYCCEYPTAGYKWIIDNNLQVLNDIDIKNLKSIFHVLNEDKEREKRLSKEREERFKKQLELRKISVPADNNGEIIKTVWEDFNEKNSVHSVLENHNFTFLYSKGSKDFYLRNGSSAKHSGFVQDNLYVNFSDNAGLPQKKSGGAGRKFTAFQLVTFWNFNGDFQKAGQELSKKGYGIFKKTENQQQQGGYPTRQKTSFLNSFTLNNNTVFDVLKNQKFENGLYQITAGTGTGKSYYVANAFEKVLIISRNITTLENYNQYNFNQFLLSDKNEYFADLQSNPNKLTVTYKSFKKLRQTVDLSDYVIVFDEAHLLNESYKEVEQETKYCYYSINELSKTNTVLLMSANEIYFNDSATSVKSKFYFKNDNIKRSLSVVYNANYKTLNDKIQQRIKQGRKVLIFTNRKENKIISDEIKKANPDKTIYFFDSSKHNEINLSKLTHDITVSTSALVTGKDIKNDNLSVIFYAIDRSISRSSIIQFFGRARNYKSASFDLLLEFKESENFGAYSKSGILAGAYMIAKSTIKASVNDYSFLRENKQRFVKKCGNNLIIDYFNIDKFLQQRISEHTILNSKRLIEFLTKNNFNCSIEVLEDLILEKTADTVLTTSQKYDIELNKIDESVPADLNENEFLTNVFNRYNSLLKIGFDSESSLDICNVFKSRMKFKRFIDLLIVESSLKTNDKNFVKIYNDILNLLNEFLTVEEILERLQKLKILKKYSSYELSRIVLSAQKTDSSDLKKVRLILKKMKSYYDVDSRKSNKKNYLKHTKTDYLKALKPVPADLKNLYKYSDLIK